MPSLFILLLWLVNSQYLAVLIKLGHEILQCFNARNLVVVPQGGNNGSVKGSVPICDKVISLHKSAFIGLSVELFILPLIELFSCLSSGHRLHYSFVGNCLLSRYYEPWSNGLDHFILRGALFRFHSWFWKISIGQTASVLQQWVLIRYSCGLDSWCRSVESWHVKLAAFWLIWLLFFWDWQLFFGDMLGVPIKGDSRYDLKYILIDTATFAASPFISDKMTLPLWKLQLFIYKNKRTREETEHVEIFQDLNSFCVQVYKFTVNMCLGSCTSIDNILKK